MPTPFTSTPFASTPFASTQRGPTTADSPAFDGPTFDVLIAGAGPTGLTLAAELSGAGLRCLVVERRPDASPHSRAFTVMPYTLELLDMRGQAEAMIQRGLPWRYAPFGDGKHYLDFAPLHSRFPYMLLLPQHDTEDVLQAWAVACGAQMRRNARVTGVTQEEDGVTVEMEQAGRSSTARARFIVGCDGAHSTVRGLLGIPFEGRSYDASLIIADVHLRHPPDPPVHARIAARGMAALFPFGDTRFRLILLDHARMHVPVDEAVTLAEIQESAQALLGVDLGIHDPIWLSRFRSQQRLAARYRQGRALLAGDAAHTHMPSGGQGLQVGVQDGFNLGWKLAAHIQGWAPDGLLDSYQHERHPIAAEALRQTDVAFRYETSRSAWVRAARQVAWRVMRFKGVQKSIIDNFAGFRLRYPPPPAAAAHRLTGRRIPETVIVNGQRPGTRVHEVLRQRRFVLIDQTPDGRFAAETGAGWDDRLRVMRGRASNGGRLPMGVLVRPDGIVAWATSGSESAGLQAALRQWCGEAGTPS
jgi:2-polyprenyl-6-methoxyphenol hydroxylase-like FAD-dependent oxidoreductase